MFRAVALGDYRAIYKRFGNQKRKAMPIWGTADAEISRQMIDEVREAIPYIEFHTLEDTGQTPNFEVPDQLSKLIVDFLK